MRTMTAKGLAIVMLGAALPCWISPGGSAARAESGSRIIAHPEVPRIPARELVGLLERKADVVVIDTQAAENYRMWHIPTAVNVPYSVGDDPTEHELLLVDLPMDRLIVVYCLCEEGSDSARVALGLRQLGFDPARVKVLEGGLVKWDEAGYPIVRTETPE